MQVKLVKQTATEAEVSASGAKVDLMPIVEEVLTEFREEVKAPGFRPGKAPNQIVEREVGEARVQAEVIQHAAQAAYSQALKAHELQPIEAPHVEVKKFVPYTELELVLSFAVMPEVKLPDYKKIKKTPAEGKVTDEDIAQVLEALRSRAAARSEAKRPAKLGDEVEIDMEGSHEGKPVAGATGKNYPVLLGSGRFVPGFEEALVGLEAGGDKTFTITFPKDYGEAALAGAKVEFKVKAHKVSSVKLPELDDKFASAMGPFKTLADLKSDITRHLKAEKAEEARRVLVDEVVGEVVEKSKTTLPPKIVERQFTELWQEFEQRVATSGQSVDEYFKAQGQTRDAVEKELKTQAERRVKTSLVLSAVARAEKLKISAEELELRVQMLQGQVQDPATRAQLGEPQARQDIADQLMIEKTVNKLAEYATN